jgi:hypothetical protein
MERKERRSGSVACGLLLRETRREVLVVYDNIPCMLRVNLLFPPALAVLSIWPSDSYSYVNGMRKSVEIAAI